MIPHLAKDDMGMFYNYLDKSNFYFEFGSGGSTYQASIRPNIKQIWSVESDIEWHNTLKQKIKNEKVNYIYNEMGTLPNTWGNPGINSTNEQKINYSNHILNLNKEEQQKLDIVFIDGRFRVVCCLKSFDVINKNCVIIFDDFLNRPYYHIILNYFNIIEQTKDKRMVILKKKKDMNIPEEIIKKYELDQR